MTKRLRLKPNPRWSPIAIVLCAVVLAFFVSALIFPFLYTAYQIPRQDSVFFGSEIEVKGDQFSILVGDGVSGDNVVELTELEDGMALLMSRTDLDASRYSVIHYRIKNGNPAPRAELVWHLEGGGQDSERVPIDLSKSASHHIDMSGYEGWTGKIDGIGLAIYGTLEQPLILEQVTIGEITYAKVVHRVLTDWLTFKPWQGTSINSLLWLYKDPIISPIVLAALWSSIALLCLLVLRACGVRSAPAAYLTCVLIPWVAVDLVWQVQLTRQAKETSSGFAGLTDTAKHKISAPLMYDYAQHLRENVLLSTPEERIFLVHNSQGHNYYRLRLQYFLLPANIYNFGRKLPDPNDVKPGDYVILLQDVSNARYIPSERKLQQGARVLGAVEVDRHHLGKTYRISSSPKRDDSDVEAQ